MNKNEEYQTQLLILYANKIFSYMAKDKKDIDNENVLQGDLKKYYDLFLKIIEEPDCCYNKRTILDYIENSWMKKPKIYLYSKLKEHDKALNLLFNEAKISHNFEEIEKYCEKNKETQDNIFQIFYKLLEMVKLKDEINNLNEMKNPFEEEMLRLLKNYGSIQNLDPLFALNYANEHINVCENNDFFNYLTNVITEFTEERNKFKITKNLSEMSALYKETELMDYKKRNVLIDSNKICDLCKKKIGNTHFVIYPDLKVYHSRCIRNISIDPLTGVDFSKKKCLK